jgi:hypothetical protein
LKSKSGIMILMGIGDWRAKRNIKYPERGVLRVIGLHDGHSRPSQTGTRIAGIITAPGIPATRIEHKMEDPARWTGHQALPVLLDRTDPTKFVVLWEELESGDWQDPGEVDPQYAGAPSTFGPNVISTSSSITIGPDGRPINVPLSPEAAARVQSALGKAFGSGRGQILGRVIGEVVEQALGQATGQPYGQGGAQPYGQPSPAGQPYGQGGAHPYGQPSPEGQPFGQGEPHAFNQPPPQDLGQAGGRPFGQVDPQAFSQPFGQVGPEAFRSPEDDQTRSAPPQAD